jgi:quercetin dioxygenase-like cupin family protein
MRSNTALITIIAVASTMAACSKDSRETDTPSAPPTAVAPASANGSHQAQTIQWGPAPSVLPPGAEIAVLAGDPGSQTEFTLRLKFPNGYRIAPHTHPTTENVTVIKGTFLAGMGTQFVEANLQELGRDDFVSIPAEHPHFAMARGETIVQVHGLGPFVLTYVNPADDPSK